jgi:hypothetical protein
MKLSVIGLACAFAVVWGAACFLTGVGNLISQTYGREFLLLLSSIYPGYKATASFGQVIIGTTYGIVDAGIAGAVFAWLYNLVSARFGSPASA